MSERDTPETDAAAIEASGHCDDDGEGQAVVSIRFARRLERERDEAREALQECESVLRRVGCDMTADMARAVLEKVTT